MTPAEVVAAACLMPFAALGWVTFAGPWGILPSLVPRRWRWWFRHLRDRGSQRSARISKRLRARVLRADRGRCVHCGTRRGLQIDHIVPWSMGGVTCLWNLAVLCRYANRVKSNYWVSGSGRRYYRPMAGRADMGVAAAILAAERRARRNPLRWLRAFV